MITVGDNGNTHNLCGEDRDSWTLTLHTGKQSHTFTLAQLKEMGSKRVSMRIECVSAGYIAGGRNKEMVFTGYPLGAFLDLYAPDTNAQTVIFRSKAPAIGGPEGELHETALELDYCRNPNILLAWELNDEPLPYPNGGPLRSTVGPDRYFFKAMKWLGEIELSEKPLSECRGTWETYGGYHNVARTGQDPEERFEPLMRMIERIDEGGKDVTKVIPSDQWQRVFEDCLAKKDFSRMILAKGDLMGLNLDQDYSGVRFVDGSYVAKIRGTFFRKVDFQGTDFSKVNLSLCRFPGCRFSDEGANPANLSHCDMEGAHFTGADLRGVIMKEACLTGVHFYLQSHREKNEKRTVAKVEGLDLRGSTNLDEQQKAWLIQDGAIFDQS